MEAFSHKHYIIVLSLEFCVFLSVNVEDRKQRKQNEVSATYFKLSKITKSMKHVGKMGCERHFMFTLKGKLKM